MPALWLSAGSVVLWAGLRKNDVYCCSAVAKAVGVPVKSGPPATGVALKAHSMFTSDALSPKFEWEINCVVFGKVPRPPKGFVGKPGAGMTTLPERFACAFKLYRASASMILIAGIATNCVPVGVVISGKPTSM